MKKIFALLACAFFCSQVFSEKNSAAAANRRTAKRYLQIAKQHAADRLWTEAESEARLGLAYDETVADLWYICAVSKANLGAARSEILPLIKKSLDGKVSQWVDYNKDNARILYADALCGTLQFKDALKVLDMKPLIYSADAEYIRIQCYYALGDGSSVEKARDRVDSARKVYPDDVRFAELFYNHEYEISRKGGLTLSAQRIASSFFPMMKNYKDASDDLNLLAISFVPNEEERVRLLRSFSAEGKMSVMYPLFALNNGILDEASAISQFCSFADASSVQQPLRLSILESFAANIPDESARKSFADYLNSFDGVISADTDGDLFDNLIVSYDRGRPNSMTFDRNQDGILDWSAECDFGTPVSIRLFEDNLLEIEYDSWPFLKNAIYTLKDGTNLSLRLTSETLQWSPFEIGVDPILKSSLGAEFYVPAIPSKNRHVTGIELLVASSKYTRPSKDRPNAVVEVSVLNGVPQTASYSENGKVYALAQFENGIPSVRIVDSDGDGLFETTEQYGMTNDLSKKFITEDDEIQIITNLFGAGAKGTGFYVKFVQLDKDGDTIPDFTEEYTEGFGKISTWDTNSDGKWDIRYTKKPRKDDKKPLVEVAEFHQPLTNSVVAVTCENGVPMNVVLSVPQENGKEVETVRLKIFRSDAFPELFWIGQKEDSSFDSDIVSAFAESGQGISDLIEVNTARFHAVRIGGRIFAEQLNAAAPIEKPEL